MLKVLQLEVFKLEIRIRNIVLLCDCVMLLPTTHNIYYLLFKFRPAFSTGPSIQKFMSKGNRLEGCVVGVVRTMRWWCMLTNKLLASLSY